MQEVREVTVEERTVKYNFRMDGSAMDQRYHNLIEISPVDRKNFMTEDLKAVLAKESGVQVLNLSKCERLYDLPDLSMCKNLISIHLTGCEGLGTLPDFAECKSLLALYLAKCKKIGEKIVGAKLGFLRKLELKGLKSLKVLDISGCEFLSSISGFDECENLEKLNLHDCKYLSEVSSLEECKNLKRLDLSLCINLKSFPEGLGELPKLEFLSFMDSGIKFRGEKPVLSSREEVAAFFERHKVERTGGEAESLICALRLLKEKLLELARALVIKLSSVSLKKNES
jgi:hypothetical protein